MDNADLDFYKRVKEVHESIYSDNMGGSPLDKCFLMAYLFKNLNFKNYVEIGVYRGKSLFPVSVAVKENGGHAYGIDPYLNKCFLENDLGEKIKNLVKKAAHEINFDELYQEVAAFGEDFGFVDTVTLLRQTSDDAASQFRANKIPIDMLHIDGNHDYDFVKSDAGNYIPFIREGGIIVFDDINWKGVRKVYEEEKKTNIPLLETDTFGILLKSENGVGKEEQVARLQSLIEKEKLDYSYVCNLRDPIDLLVVDDAFPCPLSSFRMEEYLQYLKHFDSIRIYGNSRALKLLTSQSNTEVFRNFKKSYPQYSEKAIQWGIGYLSETIQAKLAYFCFLNNVYYSLEILELNGIPFVFELYPGGGFALHDPQSDLHLRQVTQSNYFRKVIVTQKVTHDYLIENGFCTEDQIVTIFGVVTASEKLNQTFGKMKHFGFEKDRLDVCFTAMKYTPRGEDKGYDVFIEVAKVLYKKYPNIYFHVVGNFDENVIDVSDIKDRITFYGAQKLEWFDNFYLDKDIIVSPNVQGKILKGAFDGFPTGCCVDAGLRETAMFCTDELEQNDGYFKDGAEIVITQHNAEDITQKIEYYYQHPKELQKIAVCGSKQIKELYSWNAQIKPRIQLLEQEIANYVQNMLSVKMRVISGLENQLKEETHHCENLSDTYNNLRISFSNLEQEYTTLVKNYQDLEDYTKNLQKSYIDLENDDRQKNSYYNELKTEYDRISGLYTSLSAEKKNENAIPVLDVSKRENIKLRIRNWLNGRKK